jgi:hypothetical protein
MVREPWFNRKVLVTFEDGPCAGMVIEAPGRSLPPSVLFVRADGTDPRSGSAHDGSDGYTKYLMVVGDRRTPGEPFRFMLWDVDRRPSRHVGPQP